MTPPTTASTKIHEMEDEEDVETHETCHHPFPLTPDHPVEMYRPYCQGCFRCKHILRMSNVLYSPISKWIVLWSPKCACSSIRWFFLEWQKTVNPWAFRLTHTKLSYHHIYRKRTYQYGYHYPDYQVMMQEHPTLTIIIRHPFYRFLSCFLQKYVLEKDIKIFRHFSLRELRLGIDTCNEMFTIRTLLRFLNRHGCIDIHDCPFTCQFPESFITQLKKSSSPRIHVLDSDSTHFWLDLKKILRNLHWFTTSKRSFQEFDALFQKIPSLNCTPFGNGKFDNDVKDVLFWDWSLARWRQLFEQQKIPSRKWFHQIWSTKADEEIKQLFVSLYLLDIEFYQNFCKTATRV